MAAVTSLRKYITLRGTLIALNVLVLLSVAVIWPKLVNRAPIVLSSAASTSTPTATSTHLANLLPTNTPTIPAEPSSTPTIPASPVKPNPGYTQSATNPLVLSLPDYGNLHLFLYEPATLLLTRLTNEPWDDIHPAFSPDSSSIAFSSRRNGYWDIYLLSLNTGELTRLTDTLAYDGYPAWSPDGSWIAYETYDHGNLDIAIIPAADPDASPIYLTNSPGADSSPAWSPRGRQIAYVSTADGNADIWVADLDAVTNPLTNLTSASPDPDLHPAWSPDGAFIAYSTQDAGIPEIAVLEYAGDSRTPRVIATGSWPVWSEDGSSIAALIKEPNREYLAAFDFPDGALSTAIQNLPAGVEGISWAPGIIPDHPYLPSKPASVAQSVTDAASENSARLNTTLLDGVTAPQPVLLDPVVPAFNLLRNRVAYESGWDFLANLENAYVPLTSPLPPGMERDWLYTGRAIAFPSAPLSAGWLTLVREEYSGQTFWRVYLKSRYQDGSQGRPLSQMTWDVNTRLNGNPGTYEQGGSLSSTGPEGYWVDLTDLAIRYGWERVPSLPNWRTHFGGIRFNELVIRGGLSWEQAMLDLYPPEVLITPTPVLTATRTPTRVPTWYKTRTPTPTLTPTISPTPRPTWTPLAATPGIGG